jgi:hypothetical protein
VWNSVKADSLTSSKTERGSVLDDYFDPQFRPLYSSAYAARGGSFGPRGEFGDELPHFRHAAK